MKRLMLLVCNVCITFSLSAQEIDDLGKMIPNTVDLRSLGMGKTEVAGKLGSNAIFSNPSLLALQEKGSIKLGTTLNFGFIDDERVKEEEDRSDAEIKTIYRPNFKFSNMSATLPIHFDLPSVPLALAFGIGYQNAVNLSFTRYSKSETSYANQSSLIEIKDRYTGGLNTVSPGLAIGILDRISLGMSLNIGFSKLRIRNTENRTVSTPTGETETESEGITVFPGSCFYPTFGLTGKPLENLAIGVSITPSYEWEWDDGEFESEDDELDDEAEYDISGGEFTMPLKFSAGLEYQITPAFALAVEYQIRPYETFKFDADLAQNSEYIGDDLSDIEYQIKEMDLKNGHVLHAGAEIAAGKVPVRLGFFLEPYPSTSQELKNNTVKYVETPNYVLGGTFGLGIPASEAVYIDFAAQYGFTKVIKVYTDVDMDTKEFDHKEHLIRVDLGLKIDLPEISIKTSAKNSSSSQQQNAIQNNRYNSSSEPSYNSSPSSNVNETNYSTPTTDQSTTPTYDSSIPSTNESTIDNQGSGY